MFPVPTSFQLIRFARVSIHLTYFNARNKSLTAKLLQQGYRYNTLRKVFFKFYRRHFELVSKYNMASVRPHVCFILVLILISVFLR